MVFAVTVATPIRVNVGCGASPTNGWVNIDNSLTVRLANMPLFRSVARLLSGSRRPFFEQTLKFGILSGNVLRSLPLPSGAAEVVYSSHMLEHLDRKEVRRALDEFHRILAPGGILRVAMPDLRKAVNRYVREGDADRLIDELHLSVDKPRGLVGRLRWLLVGPRHHHWMYDSESFARLLADRGFSDIRNLSAGETTIANAAPLNLREREDESFYIEARRTA